VFPRGTAERRDRSLSVFLVSLDARDEDAEINTNFRLTVVHKKAAKSITAGRITHVPIVSCRSLAVAVLRATQQQQVKAVHQGDPDLWSSADSAPS
jgi:hypothetical protein